MKFTKQKLREAIKEQIDLLIEQEVAKATPTPEKLPPDVERNLKTGFASRFDELVKTNINTPEEAEAFLGQMIDLMEKISPQIIVRVLTRELEKRREQAGVNQAATK